jgi:hypothetical protein
MEHKPLSKTGIVARGGAEVIVLRELTSPSTVWLRVKMPEVGTMSVPLDVDQARALITSLQKSIEATGL